ncbi:MAG: LysR family transcriptional regulator, partial [Chromatiales bacterium]|nr:LysR family transcriptional regulator [Chromatiales bacterium]
MNLRDLRYFIAVAETRHFGRAASSCFVSQPTLSAQIRKLEGELGVVLFERTNRQVSITPIGETLLPHARRAIEAAQALTDVAHAQRDPLASPLRFGAIPTLSPYLMPLILAPLRRQFPDLRLILSEELTEQLLKRLVAHEIDVALL